MSALLSPQALEDALHAIGAERYHNLHVFHHKLHNGDLTRGQVQAWALNRYYYQSQIPAKDASLLARLPTAELRREWRSRLVDHDGNAPGEGGIARWLRLAEGVGLDPAYVESTEGLLPGTRFAVDAYVHFVRDRSVLEAVASSLTEMFSPTIIAERVAGMLSHYDFVTPETLAYFTAAPDPGAQGRELRTLLRQGACTHAGAAGAGPRRAALQMRRAVVATGCAAFRLCFARVDSAGRVRAGRHAVIAETAIPAYAPGRADAGGPGARRLGRAGAGAAVHAPTNMRLRS